MKKKFLIDDTFMKLSFELCGHQVSKYLKEVRKGHIAMKVVSRSVEVMISLISLDILIIRILNLYVIRGEKQILIPRIQQCCVLTD